MRKQNIFLLTLLFSFIFHLSYGQAGDYSLKETSISTAELKEWTFLGMGEVSNWGSQTSLQEADETKGVMLVSPNVYGENVIVRYKAMALTPATVIVTLLSVSDVGKSDELTIPDNYDGSISLWTSEKENYFFAFKNASHNVTPFVRKQPNSKDYLAIAPENYMIAGVYYDIEVGKYNGKVWLSIDGEKVFETTDKQPLKRGHIAIRLRGTAGFAAGCLFKDMVILSE